VRRDVAAIRFQSLLPIRGLGRFGCLGYGLLVEIVMQVNPEIAVEVEGGLLRGGWEAAEQQ
jgi:hypothetical protein